MPPIFNRKRVSGEDEDEPIESQDVWVRIDKTVRNVDEEKIKDCTDDIDTLLVFAGLYSAVLTAFLIESYKTLTSDPTQALLQQLVSQSANYRFTGGFLNTTFDMSQLPVFEVATSAIRVNVCWFASLVISLSTASYGILVKQWLREYLAIDRTAAHERLRVRHFRKQGLETWKLYDIAAILPMFLQLSLILFLVGLCFFTASVHESIGRTSLVLVCAWAFFLALAILAPLISARCPYKTSFLKSAFRHLRPHAHFLADKVVNRVLWVAARVYSSMSTAFSTISHRCLGHWARFVVPTISSCWRRLRAMCRPDSIPAPANDSAHSAVAPQHGGLLTHDMYEDAICDDKFHLEYMVLFAENKLGDPTNAWREESDLRSDERGDPIMFQNIDSIFLDDGLLFTMRRALQRRPPPGKEVLKSVIGILQHRSDLVFRDLNAETAVPVPWPWALSMNARTILVDILMDCLLFEVSKNPVDDWYKQSHFSQFWMNQALCLIFVLSAGNRILPQSTPSVLKGWLCDRDKSDYVSVILADQLKAILVRSSKPVSIIWQAHVLSHLLAALILLPTEDAAKTFTNIVAHSHGDLNDLIPTDSSWRTQELPPTGYQDVEHAEAAQNNKVSPFVIFALLDVAAGILNSLTIAQTDKPEGAEPERITVFPESVQGLLDFMFQAVLFIQRTIPDAIRNSLPISEIYLKTFTWKLFTASTPHHTYAFLEFWSRRSTDLQVHLRSDQLLSRALASWLNLGGNNAVEFLSACAGYFDAKLTADTPLELVSAIQLCHLVYLVRTSNEGEVLCARHAMFTSIINCFNRLFPDPAVQEDQESKLPQCTSGDHTDTCSAASALLAAVDEDDNDRRWEQCRRSYRDREYPGWLTSFNTEEAQMPDIMVKILLRFVCEAHTKDDEDRTFWRVRRLHDPEVHKSRAELKTTGLDSGTAARDAPLLVARTDEVLLAHTVSTPFAPLDIANTLKGSVSTSAVQAIPNSASPPSPAADSSSCSIHPSSVLALATDSEMHDVASRDPNNTLDMPADSVASQDAAAVAAAQSATGMDIAESLVSTNSGCDDETATIAPDAQSRDIQASIQSLPSTPHDAGIVFDIPAAVEQAHLVPEIARPALIPAAPDTGPVAFIDRTEGEGLEPQRSELGRQAESAFEEIRRMAKTAR